MRGDLKGTRAFPFREPAIPGDVDAAGARGPARRRGTAEKGGRPRSSSGGLPGVMTPIRRLQGRVEVCHWARRQGHSKERDSVCSAWTQETPRGEPKMDTWEQTEATGREQAVTALWAWLCT